MKTVNYLVRITLTLCLLISPIQILAQQDFSLPDDVTERQADIYSEGTRLAAHIFTPKSANSGVKLPAIIMAQGWGGAQNSLFRDAAEFAQAGYFVATFDFRGWGESDSRIILSEPMPGNTTKTFTAEVSAIREVMDPMDMGMDWLNALHWIQAEDQVDTDSIGIWGSSMAGGFAIYAAANDLRVKAIHSQVTGTVDGRLIGNSPDGYEEATRRARGELAYPEARASWNGLNGYPIFARFSGYRPVETFQHNDSVALQIVLAEEEEYGTNGSSKAVFEAHDGPKNLVMIPGIGHYGIYTTGREQSHSLAQAWFDKYLKGH